MPHPISDLDELIRSLRPELMALDYAFCQIAPADEARVLAANPLSTFAEPEGLSVVIEREAADRLALRYDTLHRCIALRVHSSLTAVGLTAAVSGALADAGLSANVVAAHSHDYVFVPSDRADDAIKVLRALSRTQAIR